MSGIIKQNYARATGFDAAGLSAYAPVNIADLNWVILSEIHEREAFATIDRFNERIFTFVLGVLMLIILASGWLCWFISRESRNQQG